MAQLLYAFVAGLLIGISALVLVLVFGLAPPAEQPEARPFHVSDLAEYDGVTRIDPPLAIPLSSLLNLQGKSTDLGDFSGKYVLLTFGFTHCPDICPLTLDDYRQTQRLLGESAERVHFVFVSVDGRRDTPEALRDYLKFRELDRIIGLTGTAEQVGAFGAPFGLSFEIGQEQPSGNYLINHTAGSFLLDPAGRWIKRFQFAVPPERIAKELRSLLGA